MDYGRDPDDDERMYETRETVTEDNVMELFDQYVENGTIPFEMREYEIPDGVIDGMVPAVYEDGLEQETGRFLSLLMNQGVSDTYRIDRDEDLAGLGFNLAPGKTLHIDADTERVGYRAAGRIINHATITEGSGPGRHNAFGTKADGQLINDGDIIGVMGENSYGIGINDGTIDGSLGRKGWGSAPPNHGTFINHGEVTGVMGGGDSLYINTGLADHFSGTEEPRHGIYMNFGETDGGYDWVEQSERQLGTLIDPELDEQLYDGLADQVIGAQTLEEHPALQAYISSWEDLVTGTDAEELMDTLELLDPDFESGYRSQFIDRQLSAMIEQEDYDDPERFRAELRAGRHRQQPMLRPLVSMAIDKLIENPDPGWTTDHPAATIEAIHRGL